jgi:hypothetical protein
MNMGTTSTTKIYQNGKLLLALYKQYDGYVEGGWGDDLKKFLKSGTFVNGINASKGEKIFNGAGCFALQLVKEFKDGAGELYATTEDDEQDYNYMIDVIHRPLHKYKEIKISCKEDPQFNEILNNHEDARGE